MKLMKTIWTTTYSSERLSTRDDVISIIHFASCSKLLKGKNQDILQMTFHLKVVVVNLLFDQWLLITSRLIN